MSRKQVEWLRGELRAWQKEGLVSAEQAEGILARRSYTQALSGAPSRALTRLLAVLGGLLVGMGLILFFSANWRAIPDGGKLGLIFGGILISYALGYWLKFRRAPLPGLAAGFFFLGAVAYGSGIFLVAEIYNFHADWRTGVLYWFLGTWPLAYALESRPVLWLSLGTLIFWLSSRFGFVEIVMLYQVLGAVMVAAALRLSRFAKSYFSLGAGLVLFSTLMLTFEEVATGLARGERAPEFGGHYATLLVIYLVLLAGVGATGWKKMDTSRRALVTWLSVVLAPGLYLFAASSGGNAYLVLVNLLLFAECVGLMLFGLGTRTKWYVNVGIAFFLTLVTVRYFDSYWGYLPRSVFFVFGGALLLGLGYTLEKKRRQWMARLDGGAA